MTWKIFLVAWAAGALGVTLGRWLLGRGAARVPRQQEQSDKG